MNYAHLGKTGLKVSRICLGCMTFGGVTGEYEWTLDLEKSRPIIERAIDLGINFFDTADEYSLGKSEQILGAVLDGRQQDENLIVATKVFQPVGDSPNSRGLSLAHIRHQIKKSLENLKRDYVDLYQIHRWDYSTPISETLIALNDLVRQGKVNYIGASSMYAWQFTKSLFTSDLLRVSRFVSMQNHYSLLYREEEREMLPLCRDQGIAILPWSPLARGFLAGKYKRNQKPEGWRYEKDDHLRSMYFTSQNFDVAERVQRVAQERGVKPAQIALAWLFNKKEVNSIVLGASNKEHLDDAVEAMRLHLSDAEIRQLEEVYSPHEVQGPY